MKSSISIKNLTKEYRIFENPSDRVKEIFNNGRKQYGYSHYALRDISLEIHEGEILGIIGVNGSGKSTLLKIITGVLTPSAGTVEVNGKISALLELGAGFNPDYTGIENIYFNGMVMGFSRKEIEQKIAGIIEFADIGDYIDQPVKTYSSGMYVRLAYAVAVSIEPDILIVDEALAVGDAYFQLKSMSKMQELFKKGKTVLFVSHDTASIKSLCKTALYLDKGQIVAYGPAKEVVELYETQIREGMSSTKRGVESDEVDFVDTSSIANSRDSFRYDDAFVQRVAHSKEGSGEACVCALELRNSADEYVQIVDSKNSYKLRMYIEFIEDCKVAIGYHIRDNKNIPILGSNTVMENIGEINGHKGERVIVDFITKLPLQEGRYNVMTVISHTIIMNRSSEFIEVTKDGLYFDVMERKPIRIWNKVQIPNEVQITRCE